MTPDDKGEQGAEVSGASALPLKAVDLLVKLGGILSTLLILAAICQVSYAIFQRYVLQSALLWSDELIGYGLVALIMLGAAEAYRKGDHISIDLVTATFGPGLSRAASVWADLSVLIIAVVLGWSTWEAVTFAYDFGSYSPGEIEIATWIPQIPMLIGAVLLGLSALTRLIRQFAARTR